MEMQKVILKYDGRWTWFPQAENRQWTVMSHFIDAKGQDRYKGSFDLIMLFKLGIIKGGH